MPGCQVPPLNGSRGAAREMSRKRAVAIGVRPSVAVHSVLVRGPVCEVSNLKSHSPFGIAHSSRPPATDSGESTQMSVIVTRRPCSFVAISRATRSSR
jgi:hypothetical protein